MPNYTAVLDQTHKSLEEMLEGREEKQKAKTKRAKAGVQVAKPKKLTKKELQIQELAASTVLPDHYSIVWTEFQLHSMCNWLSALDIAAVDTETMGIDWTKDEIVGISFYAPHKGFYIPLKHDTETCLPLDLVISCVKPILEDQTKKWLFHNFKFDAHILRRWFGGTKIKAYYDTMLGCKLLDENQSAALKDAAPIYLKVPADKFSTLFGKITFDKIPLKLNEDRTGCLAGYYAIYDTELTFKLAAFQMNALKRPKLENIRKLMFDVEMPFLHIAIDAEARGVRLDVPYLENVVAKELHEEIEVLRGKIERTLGKINLNSPVQLSEALYIGLGLPRVNKKNPKSTDAKTLRKLKGEHPVIGHLLEYRGKVKLTTAFAEKLPKSAVNGRVHCSFSTIGTKTGRLACQKPNLQQVPARVGGLIRNAFLADEGRLLVSIDYSGQELRVLAHITQDETLMNIFLNGGDVHSMTGVGIFNRQYPGQNIKYEFFQYCREMTGKFQDENGKIVKSRFQDKGLLQKLYDDGVIAHAVPDALLGEAELGIKFEKARKAAKTVNFGRVTHLCRSKTPLKTVKATA